MIVQLYNHRKNARQRQKNKLIDRRLHFASSKLLSFSSLPDLAMEVEFSQIEFEDFSFCQFGAE